MDYWEIHKAGMDKPFAYILERPGADVIKTVEELNGISPDVRYRAEPKNFDEA